MNRVNIICEGQTETRFVSELLGPHFAGIGTILHAALVGRPGKKGGNVSFGRLLKDIRIRLLNDRTAYCTTFFDLYGLQTDFPGRSDAAHRIALSDKACALRAAMSDRVTAELGADITRRFLPYVQMYEFEGLLFSDPAILAKETGHPELETHFSAIRSEFDTPEHINDNSDTAPSKRIRVLIPRYRKPTMGESVAKSISLPKIRQQCPLFNAWLTKLENLPPLPA